MDTWLYDPAADADPVSPAEIGKLPRGLDVVAAAVRELAAAVVRGWLHTYHRLTIVGREHLPHGRSFILVANHASHLDTLCLLAALPFGQLRHAFPAAAEDYFCATRLRALLARVLVNALPFDRCLAPWHSLALCSHLLDQPGNVLIFFPEGTRSSTDLPGEFKPGVGLLAAGRDLPVLPCHLTGTRAALPKGGWCPRPVGLRLTIGAPRVYAHLPPTKEAARRIGRELREAVIALGQAPPAPTAARKSRLEPLLKRPVLDA